MVEHLFAGLLTRDAGLVVGESLGCEEREKRVRLKHWSREKRRARENCCDVPGWMAFSLSLSLSILVASGLRVASPPPKPLPGPSCTPSLIIVTERAGRAQVAARAGTRTPEKADTGAKANMIRLRKCVER